MADQVMSPKNKSGRTGVYKQVKSSLIEGPTATSSNLQPFTRSESKKK